MATALVLLASITVDVVVRRLCETAAEEWVINR
jgi:hypothetical protein